MDRTNKQWLAVTFACVLAGGLAGCATPQGDSPAATTTSQAPTRSILGASRYMPAMLSPTDCMKFEAMPHECEAILR